ncbi:unnamed protein product [Phytomonas sp. Hart1]|nr:unnamed protein product [Phytomonas sp. Hart1]|eukprot:CCW67863.1 unnamed protein product [Phytomonas sp. isolate Hart1]
MKPLLIFGLRGTLIERLYTSRIPNGMPTPDLTVGITKVWLRPHLLSTLRALQEHCNLAVWSSTTGRNTNPLVNAVFNFHSINPSLSTNDTKAPDSAETPSRFRKRGGKTSSGGKTGDAPAGLEQPLKFEFIWSREHTSIDEFRRRNSVVNIDAHATVKDLSRVFQQFPEIAQPSNTIIIDDTPSKCKLQADNYIWLDTCEELAIQDEHGMKLLQSFIMEKILPAKDVRGLLPVRISTARTDPKI